MAAPDWEARWRTYLRQRAERAAAVAYQRSLMTPMLRARVWDRDGGRCQYCGRALHPGAWTLDHKQPLARGGETTLENLVAACEPCNMAKGALPYETFVRRTTVT